MKLLRMAGLCLVAMCVMSMVAVGTASAAAHWLTCSKGTSSTTKYSEAECKTLSSSGEWSWGEVKGTEAAVSFGTLILKDTKVPIEGTVEVSCTGEGVGSVGPGAYSRIETIPTETIECKAGKGCEELEGKAKPLNLPWQGELTEEGTTEKQRNKITAGGKGAGWAVSCKVLGVTKTLDECTIDTGYTVGSNVLTPYHGTTTSVWLVLLDFVKGAPKANCTVGGTGSGEVLGSIGVLTKASTASLLADFH